MEIRTARMSDVHAITELIERSARGLGRGHYSPVQIEAALGTAWGVDTQLIRDGSYFVIEREGAPVACGGWSRRKTLFGADRAANRSPEMLDPATEAARIRAFFVDPGQARRGLGKALLEHCEKDLRGAGFKKAELVATLPGAPFYGAFGYVPGERIEHSLPGGLRIDFLAMRKVF